MPSAPWGSPGCAISNPNCFSRTWSLSRQPTGCSSPEYWQVNALHYGLGKRLFPSAASFHLGHDKVEMTRAFQSVCPEHVPWTEIAASTDVEVERLLDEFPLPFVAKEVRNSMGQGVHLIDSAAAFREYAHQNPVLYVQEYLPIDRDLRVVVIGDEVVAAYWRIAEPGQFHTNVACGGQVSFGAIPVQALELVAGVAARLGVDHAGFDVACVDGHYYLLEFNVLFGNQGLAAQRVSMPERILDYLVRRGGVPTGPDHCPPAVA